MKNLFVRSALAALCLLPSVALAAWSADLFRNENTLDFYTVKADGEGHWSRVWVVVIDGAPYVRLGSPAASRIEGNKTAPIVKVRVGGVELDRVRVEPAPEMADRVAAAMAEKYWSDILVRYMSHPLTLRLAPDRPATP